jgi:uridine kinase
MVGTVHVAPKKLNVIEGSYSMHPALAGHYDLRVFLSVDAVEQSRRILERNGPALHRRFMEEWVPKENRYFEEFGIASKCDIVLQV